MLVHAFGFINASPTARPHGTIEQRAEPPAPLELHFAPFNIMFDRIRQRETLDSFDYQWRHLSQGDAMLSDPWFLENVERILADELLCIDRAWFKGRRVLDAGCGLGRWSIGLLRLGCRVLAVDASAAALRTLREQASLLAPEAVSENRLETMQVNLLELPSALAVRRFDLVFSFGVLHHTGDTRLALANVASLVDGNGVLFLYLYGARSVSLVQRLALAAVRWGLTPLPFALKVRVLKLLRPGRDPHQLFDLFSPLINDRLDRPVVAGWLAELGFGDVEPTIDDTEIYLRAQRTRDSTLPRRPLPAPPYWFEHYRPPR